MIAYELGMDLLFQVENEGSNPLNQYTTGSCLIKLCWFWIAMFKSLLVHNLDVSSYNLVISTRFETNVNPIFTAVGCCLRWLPERAGLLVAGVLLRKL